MVSQTGRQRAVIHCGALGPAVLDSQPARKALLRGLRRGFCSLSSLIFFCVQECALGLSPFEEPWGWVRFDTSSGLPSQRVLQVLETADGTVWAKTDLGLAWYDGYWWHAVGPKPGFPRPAGTLAEGAAGRVLAAVDGKLLAGGKQGFRELTFKRGHGPGKIRSVGAGLGGRIVLEGNNGDLWELVGDLARRLDVTARTIWPTLWFTEGGAVWLHDNDDRLLRWGSLASKPELWALSPHQANVPLVGFSSSENASGDGLISLKYPLDLAGVWEWRKGIPPRRVPSPYQPDSMAAMDIAPDGRAVVIGHSGIFLIREGGRWTQMPAMNMPFRGAVFARFRNNGDLWVASSNGLFLHRNVRALWQEISFAAEDPRNAIHEILRARDGSTWLATRNGVHMVTPDGFNQHITSAGG